MSMRVGIIGAGIAGLTLAIRLTASGHSVVLFDKSRGVGGRTSTRRGVGVSFDHGAQYFTVRDPGFRAILDDRLGDSRWAEWKGRFASIQQGRLIEETRLEPRYVGVPGMNAIAKGFADGLEIRADSRVVGLQGSPGRWTSIDANGLETGPFDWVITTAPPVQSAALLSDQTAITDEITTVTMRPCFALMIEPDREILLPADGIRCNHPVLGWASNDHTKPGRGPKPALVIQSNNEWADAHIGDDPATVIVALKQACREAFGLDLKVTRSDSLHRWLYAKPVEPLGKPCLIDPQARLGACGDWCLAGKVEGAYRSGDACASRLIETLG